MRVKGKKSFVIALAAFLSTLELFAQNEVNQLASIYPIHTKLAKDKIYDYGLDIKRCYEEGNNPLALLDHIEKFFLPQLDDLSKNHPTKLSYTLRWVNTSLTDFKTQAKAIQTGELFISLSQKYPNDYSKEDQIQVIINLANLYLKNSNIDKSLYYTNLSLHLLSNSKLDDYESQMGKAFCLLSKINFARRKIEDAKKNIDKAGEYCNAPHKECYLSYTLEKAKYYERIGERKSAIKLVQGLQEIIRKNPNRYPLSDKATVKIRLGNIYYYDGQLKEAINSYEEALQIIEQHPFPGDSTYILTNIATSYSWLGQYEKSKLYLDKILRALKFYSNGPFPYDNVKQADRLISTFYFLAQNEQYHYADGGTLDNLRASYDYQEQYLDLLEYMSKNLSPTSARYFIDRFYYMYEEAIYVRYKLYEETQDAEYLEDAFRVAGRGKAIHVREAAQNAATEQIFPARLLQRRYDLRKRYVSLENRLYEQQEAGNASSALADSSLQAKNEYLRFLDSLEQAFPTMQQMWDIPEPPEPKLVQKQLREDNRAMVQYFIGYQYVFLFLLDGEDIVLYNTKIPEGLSGQVSKMRDALYEWALHPSDDLVEQYTSSAHWLYKKLLQPVDSLLPQRLLIVPDNCVAYIPFDVLLREKPVPETPFQDYPYLIQDHQISYAYSPYDFTKKPQGKRHKRAAVLGFAPSFRDSPAIPETVANRRGEFGPLLANQDEVRQISDFFLVRKFEGEAATREAFLENASYYKALHLATHAKANDKKGDYSYLCFTEVSDDTTTSNRLYASELYLMNLSADMVVLSACETGLGELSKGEGVISLSQAFSKAGARSLITTLWRVSDQASATLMNSFYKHLHSGKTKDAALRNAKLDYLHEATGRGAHPFFWAGYVAQGDMAPLQLSSGYFIWWICLFLLVLFVILGGLIRSKRHKAHAKN
ncbi:MAG: CHAT domain-containing protein [Phaeodactylibacter xiamenensis]|uniref:CHAT domain-containing protein n=1 Tax=Phaeodactylibacter xiamenensis TaxID=1524460 RepID=A0A098SBC9_9BACT|nr:hypothetical protein IX84_09030 [Phaeodactylibacter xiamenensis]